MSASTTGIGNGVPGVHEDDGPQTRQYLSEINSKLANLLPRVTPRVMQLLNQDHVNSTRGAANGASKVRALNRQAQMQTQRTRKLTQPKRSRQPSRSRTPPPAPPRVLTRTTAKEMRNARGPPQRRSASRSIPRTRSAGRSRTPSARRDGSVPARRGGQQRVSPEQVWQQEVVPVVGGHHTATPQRQQPQHTPPQQSLHNNRTHSASQPPPQRPQPLPAPATPQSPGFGYNPWAIRSLAAFVQQVPDQVHRQLLCSDVTEASVRANPEEPMEQAHSMGFGYDAESVALVQPASPARPPDFKVARYIARCERQSRGVLIAEGEERLGEILASFADGLDGVVAAEVGREAAREHDRVWREQQHALMVECRALSDALGLATLSEAEARQRCSEDSAMFENLLQIAHHSTQHHLTLSTEQILTTTTTNLLHSEQHLRLGIQNDALSSQSDLFLLHSSELQYTENIHCERALGALIEEEGEKRGSIYEEVVEWVWGMVCDVNRVLQEVDRERVVGAELRTLFALQVAESEARSVVQEDAGLALTTSFLLESSARRRYELAAQMTEFNEKILSEAHLQNLLNESAHFNSISEVALDESTLRTVLTENEGNEFASILSTAGIAREVQHANERLCFECVLEEQSARGVVEEEGRVVLSELGLEMVCGAAEMGRGDVADEAERARVLLLEDTQVEVQTVLREAGARSEHNGAEVQARGIIVYEAFEGSMEIAMEARTVLAQCSVVAVQEEVAAAREAERQAVAQAETVRVEAERAEAEKVEAERETERVKAAQREAERVEAEKVEAARIEAERIEAERVKAVQVEAERVEAEKAEAERTEAERVEAARIEAERAEAVRVEAERVKAAQVEAERVEAEKAEAARIEAERVEAERVEAERVEAAESEAARIEAERLEAERVKAAQVETEKAETARLEAERVEAARVEAERAEAERTEGARIEAERVEAERINTERSKAEAARIEAERVESARVEAEKVEAARIEAERIEAERVEAERVKAVQVEAERVEAEKVEAERTEAERVEAERVEAARIEAERAEAVRVEAERVKVAQVEAERVEAEKAEAARIEADRVEAARIEAERVEAVRVEAERVKAAQVEAAEVARIEEQRDAETAATRIEAERVDVTAQDTSAAARARQAAHVATVDTVASELLREVFNEAVDFVAASRTSATATAATAEPQQEEAHQALPRPASPTPASDKLPSVASEPDYSYDSDSEEYTMEDSAQDGGGVDVQQQQQQQQAEADARAREQEEQAEALRQHQHRMNICTGKEEYARRELHQSEVCDRQELEETVGIEMQRYEASQTLQAFEEEEDEARAELYAEEDAAITKEGGDLQGVIYIEQCTDEFMEDLFQDVVSDVLCVHNDNEAPTSPSGRVRPKKGVVDISEDAAVRFFDAAVACVVEGVGDSDAVCSAVQEVLGRGQGGAAPAPGQRQAFYNEMLAQVVLNGREDFVRSHPKLVHDTARMAAHTTKWCREWLRLATEEHEGAWPQLEWPLWNRAWQSHQHENEVLENVVDYLLEDVCTHTVKWLRR